MIDRRSTCAAKSQIHIALSLISISHSHLIHELLKLNDPVQCPRSCDNWLRMYIEIRPPTGMTKNTQCEAKAALLIRQRHVQRIGSIRICHLFMRTYAGLLGCRMAREMPDSQIGPNEVSRTRLRSSTLIGPTGNLISRHVERP